MQANIVELRHGFISEYQTISDDMVLYTVKRPLGSYYYDILDENDKLISKIAYERSSQTNAKKVFCDVSDKNNKPIGIMSLEKSKKLNTYYYQLVLNGLQYKMYEIKLDNGDIKLPIYRDNIQIALIEKDIETKDSKDIYQVSFSNKEDMIMCLLLALYFDDIRFPRSDMHVIKFDKNELSFSSNKELKSKYNPNWKPNK